MNVDSHYSLYIKRRYFGSLDGLRCISILAVIWSHGPGHGAGSVLARSGSRGVDLFFAISGFLITSLLLRERQSKGSISLRRFYLRRALRIFPLYYAVLGIYTLLTLMYQQTVPAGRQFIFNLRYFLTYTANMFVARTDTFGFAWSLATEEQFYCTWPWIEKYCARWAAAAMVGGLGAVLAIQQGWISVPGFPKLLISQLAPSICYGVLLAHALSSRLGYTLLFHCVGYRAAPLILLLSTALLISIRFDLFMPGLPYALIVAACVIREDHWLSSVLGSRAFASVGAVSYGMYLMTGLVYRQLEVFCAHTGVNRYGLPAYVAAVLLTFLAATISYRYYESFFMALKKKFT